MRVAICVCSASCEMKENLLEQILKKRANAKLSACDAYEDEMNAVRPTKTAAEMALDAIDDNRDEEADEAVVSV